MKKKTLIIAAAVIGCAAWLASPASGKPKTADQAGSAVISSGSEASASKSQPASPIDGLTFARRDVINDTTGKWKLSTISKIIPTEELVPAYYGQYMKDAESGAVHWIVNYAAKTVTRLSDLGGIVDVVTTEYSDDEEHDAKTLGSGMQLTEHHFTPSTGVMEEI